MWFLPIDISKIKSNLSIDEICNRLLDVIDVKGYSVIRLAPPPGHKPYRGSFDSQTFSIMRWIHYKNPFLPLIVGRVIEENGNNTVWITMFPNPFGIFIWAIILLMPFSWFDQHSLQMAAIFFIYIFVLIAYKAEAVSSMDFFRNMFK